MPRGEGIQRVKGDLMRRCAELRIGAVVTASVGDEANAGTRPFRMIMDCGAEESVGNHLAQQQRLFGARAPMLPITLETANGTAPVSEIGDTLIALVYVQGILMCQGAMENLFSVDKYNIANNTKYEQDEMAARVVPKDPNDPRGHVLHGYKLGG